MKLVIALGIQLTVVFALAASCSLTHRSGDFACTSSTDCNSGRECVNNVCVVSGTAIDAPMTSGDAPHGDAATACPAQCSSCNTETHTCIIDCSITNSCANPVACPQMGNWSCDVKCNVEGVCRNGVTCGTGTNAGACKVECTSRNTCQEVTCGTPRCDIACSGQASCTKQVSCGSSCGCDVHCTGNQSCGAGATTCTPGCGVNSLPFGSCSSASSTCHTCP